jgi:hypothetical protein
MVFEQLEEIGSRPGYKAALCADGSPLEFCERISAQPQAVALTLEPPWTGWDQGCSLASLRHLLQSIAPEEDVTRLCERVGSHAKEIRTLWVGADFAQRRGVRLYFHLSRDASAQVANGVRAGERLRLAELDLPDSSRKVLIEIMQRGTLRCIGVNFNGESHGVKLAFAHPLDRDSVEHIADRCGVSKDLLREYMHSISPTCGGWRTSRCGLALTLSETGQVLGVTVYHYTAPYFRHDQELRRFVLRLAERFVWNTEAYRYTSRLLDREGVRMRTLLGFTAPVTGSPSLRLYGQSAAHA